MRRSGLSQRYARRAPPCPRPLQSRRQRVVGDTKGGEKSCSRNRGNAAEGSEGYRKRSERRRQEESARAERTGPAVHLAVGVDLEQPADPPGRQQLGDKPAGACGPCARRAVNCTCAASHLLSPSTLSILPSLSLPPATPPLPSYYSYPICPPILSASRSSICCCSSISPLTYFTYFSSISPLFLLFLLFLLYLSPQLRLVGCQSAKRLLHQQISKKETNRVVGAR